MMDDVDLYLSLRPRSKEWMPDIPGVHKLSRTDAQQDLDSILANIATTQTHSNTAATAMSHLQLAAPPSSSSSSSSSGQPTGAGAANSGGDSERAGSRKAQRAAAAAAAAGKPVKAESKGEQSAARDADHADDDAAPSRRARLQAKINAERVLLESSHLTASQLRVELDGVRSELLQYEDAILSARREIAATERERREVELHYHLVRDEYAEQHSRLMQTRKELEESETELRVRLSKAEVEHVDLTERLNQLRQLEDEFNKKEHIIEELVLVNKQWERQIHMWEAVRGKKPTVTSPSTSASSSNPSNPSSLSPAAVRDMTALLQSAPSGLPSERSEHIPPELFDAVKGFAGLLFKAEQAVASLEAESRELKVRHNDAARSIQSLILQLDRSTSVHADLTHAMKACEAQYMEESVKVEHSLKTIHLLQKQKKDQQTLLIGYEERMKHFQQLLTAADVRADSANTFLSELLRGWNVLKYGNRQMNEVVKRMRAEYRKMRKERNEAYELLHDKLSKHTSAAAAAASSSASSSSSSSVASGVDAAEWYGEKEKKVELHYRQVTEENLRLHEQLDEERDRADKLQEAQHALVHKAKYDEDVQALHFEVDEMRRFVRAAEDKSARLEEQLQGEKEARKLAEAELQHMKEDREKEVAKAKEVEAARVAAESDSQAKAEEATERAASAGAGDSAPPLEAVHADGGVKREGEGEEMKGGGEEERTSKKRKLDLGGGADGDVAKVKEEGGEEKRAAEDAAEHKDASEQKEAEAPADIVMDDAHRKESGAPTSASTSTPP